MKSSASATVLRSLHELVHFSFMTAVDQLSDNTVRESNNFELKLVLTLGNFQTFFKPSQFANSTITYQHNGKTFTHWMCFFSCK